MPLDEDTDPGHIPDNRELQWRVKDLERRTNDRLRGGASTFQKLEEAIEAVRDEAREGIESVKPKPTPTWKVIAAFAGVVLFVAGVLWQAARYPDRDEYDKAQIETREELGEVRSDVNTIKLEQVQIRGDVDTIRGSQARMERSQEVMTERLDKALRRRTR